MSKILREDYVLGNNKVILGDAKKDLILETLGRIYIKTGNNLKLLKSTSDSTSNTTPSSVVAVVKSVHNIQISKYKLGQLLFSKEDNILYMLMNGEFVPIVTAKDKEEYDLYVRKKGDTMYGQLNILTNEPPLKVSSDLLIENLNSNYLQDYQASDFAIKNNNELILGDWTFYGFNRSLGRWLFNNTVTHTKDILTSASIGTNSFASGFGGYGWRLDGTTNTLTIDNLVVRKLMQVYEMVINQIKATNGSLWVSNSAKCELVHELTIIDNIEDFEISTLNKEHFYIFTQAVDRNGTGNYISTDVSGKNLPTNIEYGENTSFQEYRYMYYIYDIPPISDKQQLLNIGFVLDNLEQYIKVYDVFNELFLKNVSMSVYLELYDDNTDMLLYYKYFGCRLGSNNYHIVSTDSEQYALFEIGDILRCQKMNKSGDIKMYDAVVINRIEPRTYVVQIAASVFDVYTNIIYDSEGNLVLHTTEVNTNLYKKGGSYASSFEDKDEVIGNISEKDDLIKVGNIQNPQRQNSIYLTSTDDQGPYIDIISSLNRPDYLVIYSHKDESSGDEPVFTKTTKVRLGNLDGIYDAIFGNKLPFGFGLYASNAFLTGEFYLNNGKSIASFADDIALLSGKIEGIDPESIINEVENAFSATDEDGNPSGFAGLFTFDYGKEGKGLAILGDTINFYNPDSEGNYNWELPTALIKNGVFNADLIDVKELEFDKLVGISNYNPEVLESLLFLWKQDGEILLKGEIIGTDSPIQEAVGNLNSKNYIQNLTLYLLSFYIKTENGDIYKVYHNEGLSDNWSSELEGNSYIVDIPHIWYTDTDMPWNNVMIIPAPSLFELSVEPIYTAQNKEYNIISINKNSLGETILYYPDGSVLNAKIVTQSSDKSSVIGCVEYWFQQGSITPELLLEGGDSYVVNNYIDGKDPNSENYVKGLIKRINYFNFVDKFGISWRTVLTNADSIDEWKGLLTTLKECGNLELVFDYFNALHKEASSGNGLYGSDYSIQIKKILETFGKTPSVNSTVGIGIGSGIITWENGDPTYPVGMWFKYKLGLSDTINTYIEETDKKNNTNDKKLKLMSQTINEGLHILNYSYTNDNTGRFDIEYFKNGKSNLSTVKRIRFTINNGEYNGVILAPTDQII